MLEFSDKVIEQAHITVEMTEKDINNLIVTALEGGINYWGTVDRDGPDWADKPKDEPVSMWATKLLLEGNTIKILDIELSDMEREYSMSEEKVENRGMWELTLDELLNGIGKNAIQRPGHADKDNWDAEDADCILQYAIFDKIVFS